MIVSYIVVFEDGSSEIYSNAEEIKDALTAEPIARVFSFDPDAPQVTKQITDDFALDWYNDFERVHDVPEYPDFVRGHVGDGQINIDLMHSQQSHQQRYA